jgi:hypothetical protein
LFKPPTISINRQTLPQENISLKEEQQQMEKRLLLFF